MNITPTHLRLSNLRPSGLRPSTRVLVAAPIVGGPLGYLVGGALSPSIHATASSSIAAAAAANPAANTIHLIAFVVASYLLPIGAAALGLLAFPHHPRLAVVGATVGVLGWAPFSALTALDDLVNAIQGNLGNADLLDRFSTDWVMTSYLVVYVIGHLAAYILLGLAVRGVIRPWASWLLILSSPLTVAAFIVPFGRLYIGSAALTLLVLGSLPAARAVLLLRTQPAHDVTSGPIPR
jgi:hypothetical protein